MQIRDEKTPGILRSVAGMQRLSAMWRVEGRTIALVPTMGALHDGHLDLVGAACAAAERVIVSIFVNPTQFAPTEDFSAYPRDEAADLAKLAALGVNAVFAPTVAEMYPDGYATRIMVEGPARGLESDARPHFFGGVATVVAKLFIACTPDVAVFGEKDYQQLLVVRRMSADLGLPVRSGFPDRPRSRRPRPLLPERLSLARRTHDRAAAPRRASGRRGRDPCRLARRRFPRRRRT